jgi:hypothetical protein
MTSASKTSKDKSQGHRCNHPPCTCTVPHGTKYCGAECEAKGEMPEIDCNCGHPECKGGIE